MHPGPAFPDASLAARLAVLTQEANDQKQLAPMLEQVEQNVGRKPEQATADTGYFSDAALTDEKVAGIDLLVPPKRKKDNEENQTEPVAAGSETPPATQPQGQPVGESTSPTAKTAAETMREKLKTAAGKAVYKMRKAIVEPVFGRGGRLN